MLKIKSTFISCLLLVGLYGQHPFINEWHQNYRKITVDDGLPQGWAFHISQDGQGFIWMALNSLCRYDGRNFISFTHSAKDTGSPAGNSILSMDMDGPEKLWVQYNAPYDIDLINTVTCQIRHISKEEKFKWLNQKAEAVYSIRHYSGQYFYANWDRLGTFDIGSGKHRLIRKFTGEKLISMGVDRKSNIWAGTEKSLYLVKDGKLFKMGDYPVENKETYSRWEKLTDERRVVLDYIYDDNHGHLVSTAPEGIFYYDLEKKKAGYNREIRENDIANNVLQAPGGDILLAAPRCISKLTQNLDLVTIFEYPKDERPVHPFMIDGSGVVWSATGNATGLVLADLGSPRFVNHPYTNGFSHDVLMPWLHNPEKEFDASSYQIRSGKDSSGHVWVISPNITSSGGRTEFKNKILQLGLGNVAAQSFGDTIIDQFCFDKLDNCWAEIEISSNSQHRALGRLNLKSKSFRFIADLAPPFTDNEYLTALGSKICCIRNEALMVFDTTTTKYRLYNKSELEMDFGELMALPDAKDTNCLWIATNGSGIVRLNIKTGNTTHFTETNGLPNNTVYFMAPDRHGYFWCSSNKGLFRFDPANGSTASFTKSDGVQGNEFNRYHFLETPDGHFIFGGTNGYTVFHPDSIMVDRFQPQVAITGIRVNNTDLNKAVPIYGNTVPNAVTELGLGHDENFITFSFSGLEYNRPEKLLYRYRLGGIDSSWVKAGKDAVANYTFLPPGSYSFMVDASNSSGMWSDQIKTVKVTIHPPWWKTWWAYTIFLLILFSVTYLLYLDWLQRATAKQQVILKQKEAAQLKEIDGIKNKFFNNITHEFRTPLALILGPTEQMMQEDLNKTLKHQLGTIQRNAQQLLRLINQLLDMAKLEAGSMKVTLSRGNIFGFVKEILGPFTFLAIQKKIDFLSTVEHEKGEHLFDAEKINAVIANLVSNAIKFTPETGTIRVSAGKRMRQDNIAEFVFIIEDTGIGIKKDRLPFIFDRFYQVEDGMTRNYEGTGIGLALASEIASLVGGEISVESEPEKGSTFNFIFPLLKAIGQEIPAVKLLAPTTTENIPVTGLNPNDSTAPLILIVEDNEELRDFLAQVFSFDYRILVAADGEEGLKSANEEIPDVIISDLMMPVMDGYAFCSAVKTGIVTDHIAFIMLTSRTSPVNVIENLRNRADDYITKPFIVEELKLRVANIISRQEKLRLYFQRQLLDISDSQTADTDKKDEILKNPFLEQLYSIIEENLDDIEFTVDKLSKEAAVSTRTLNRKLTSLIGMPAVELIKKYKLKRASEFLAEGNNVTEVAYRTGYTSISYFGVIFKDHFGMIPSEFKKIKQGS